jgi:hypothetical protein
VVEAVSAHIVPSLLPRDLPISIAPQGVHERTRPMPPELLRSANAIIALNRPLGTQAYRAVACVDPDDKETCLFVRDGGCAPDPLYNYQTAIERLGK